jgi:hypothetical protein
MKNLLIATSALMILMAGPLGAQAATTSSSQQPSRHTMVQHHAVRHHTAMNQAKKTLACPTGSQDPSCRAATTGSVR